MAYTKQNFQDDQVLEASHLNKMEAGIATAHEELAKKSGVEHGHSNYASNIVLTGDGNAVTSISQSGNTITASRELTFSEEGHIHSSDAITTLSGYSKAESAGEITAGDTLNIAIGKLEKGLEQASGPKTDANITLSEDIWTDKTIGYIEGTATSPKKIAGAGDTLKTMFTNIFGTVADDEVNLVTLPYISSVSIGSSAYEYGTKLDSVSVTITPVKGSYKYGPAETGSTWSGNYTLSGTGFVSKNDSTNNTQTVSLSSTFTVGTSSSLTLSASRAYTAATTTAKSKMGKITDQTIPAGTTEAKSGTFNPTAKKYVYWAKSTTTDTPTTWTRYGSGQTGITDLQLSCAAGEYIWVATTENKTSFYAWNDASGKYNTDKLPTTKSDSTTSITNLQNASASGYYIYRTTDKMLQAVNTKFKLA